MHIRQELQNAYGITIGTLESRRHAAIISDALQRHRHAFSHFITLQPRRFDLLDHVATVVRDEFSASLPGMTTGRNARYYISVSISPKWFYRTLSQTRDVYLDSKTFHRDTKFWHHPADSVPLFAPWHLHALVGSLSTDLSSLALQECISRGTALHDVDVRTIDGHAALNTYITDPMRGNHLMGLQFTNDTFIYNQCLKHGVHLNWCPPHKSS